MRFVTRQYTVRKLQPRPPWSWRTEWPKEAPRTCLSHHKVPVYADRGGHGFRVGYLDYMLRLYQHIGVSRNSVRQGNHVLYEAHEWESVRHVAEWLEYVDNHSEVVFRCDIKEAFRMGEWIGSAEGSRFAVPLATYTRHERV